MHVAPKSLWSLETISKHFILMPNRFFFEINRDGSEQLPAVKDVPGLTKPISLSVSLSLFKPLPSG